MHVCLLLPPPGVKGVCGEKGVVGVVADIENPGVVGVIASALMGCADNGVCNMYAGPAVIPPSLAVSPPRAGVVSDVSVSICIAEAAVAILGSPPKAGCLPSLFSVSVACVFIEDCCENEGEDWLGLTGRSSGRLAGYPVFSTSVEFPLVFVASLLPSDVAALFELLPAAVVEGSAEGTTAIAFAAVELPFALVSCILSGEARDGGFCPDPVFVEAKGGDAIPSV